MVARGALVLSFVVLAACTASDTMEPLQQGQWPRQLPLLRGREAPVSDASGARVELAEGASDAELAAAASDWLRQRYGADLTIDILEVRDAGGSRWVDVVKTWRGIATDRRATLSLEPDGQFVGMGSFGAFDVVPDSTAPAASERVVRRAIAGLLRQEHVDEAQAEQMPIRLVYFCRSPGGGDDVWIPGWVVGESLHYIDARSGEPGQRAPRPLGGR
ncbi:MAG: hypothetical protein KDC48_17615 [Planctomycetes bacterium]|nr:hypothetical protein [Planctomycetota bacterium]